MKENLSIAEVIQVTYGLSKENVTREVNGLVEAMQRYSIPKGVIIVFNENKYAFDIPNGISVIPAYQWLIDK